MPSWGRVGLILACASWLAADPGEKASAKHPPNPPASAAVGLDELTSELTPRLPKTGARAAHSIRRNNYIDEFVFGKMERDKVPHAPLSSDEEFLRRAYLDLTGRIPQPDQVRKFLADPDPHKRDRLIDDLTNAKVDPA